MSRGPIPDDFEYPTAQRETLWTLQDKKLTTMQRRNQPRNPNDVGDIAGTSSGTTAVYRAVKTFTHKPNLFDNSSIEGSAPRRLVPAELSSHNSLIDKSLRTSDLPAAAPNAQQFQTKRCTDPLQPSYQVASKYVSASTDPAAAQNLLIGSQNQSHLLPNIATTGSTNTNSKLERDVLKIDDIFGTRAADNRSNTIIRTSSPPRDNINYSDVPLSTAMAKHRSRNCGSMALVTSDICKNDIVTLQSTRNTNPLSPVYTVTGAKGQLTTVGDVVGSKPRPRAGLRTDRPMLSLRSDDIEGAQPLRRFGER